MSTPLLLTFNAGSSTVKVGLFDVIDGVPRRLANGAIDYRAKPLTFRIDEGGRTVSTALTTAAPDDAGAVVAETFDLLDDAFDLSRLVAVGHRVVHGGDHFAGPVLVDDATLAAVDALTSLAPLHQPQSLRLIRAVRKVRPDLAQTASFDTAFHRTNADLVRRFAIPRALHDAGIKRYGFHGLSYKFIAGALARRRPDLAAGRIVMAHMGSGVSLCGLEGGASRDTSMSFSTLDGVPMATRSGALDPGVILHLLGPGGQSLEAVDDLLYHRSGLLGVSGISADSRALLASDHPHAREAIALFAFRVAGEVARLATTLGGLDALVFTAGIGEHQPLVRAAIARHLGWLGLDLDEAGNTANAFVISAPASRIAAFVIPTDEEQVIADEALTLIAQAERG